jgi:hypothetical protein
MTESLQALGDARIKDFVPLFAHRAARPLESRILT